MNNDNVNDINAVLDAHTDGFMGYPMRSQDPDYVADYERGEADWHDQQQADREAAYADEYDYGYDFNPVDQGYYDDDPSPYAGDYSEM